MQVGDKMLFEYPDFGSPSTFTDYQAHSGQVVTLVRELDDSERDLEEVGRMFEVRADDGWTGNVFAEELTEVEPYQGKTNETDKAFIRGMCRP